MRANDPLAPFVQRDAEEPGGASSIGMKDVFFSVRHQSEGLLKCWFMSSEIAVHAARASGVVEVRSRNRWYHSFCVVTAIIAGALGLSACNSGSPSSAPFVKSSDCHVSATNLNYAGCDFAGRHLANVDFESDDLRRVNFSHADLDGANVQGAKTAGVVTTGTLTDSSTVCVNAVLGPCNRPGLRSGASAPANS